MNLLAGGSLLDALVLASLSQTDAYGYALTQAVDKVVSISESTLYPVLRRLQKDGCLKTYDEPYNGRNRRYYQITPSGKTLLVKYKSDWIEYKMNVDSLLLGGET